MARIMERIEHVVLLMFENRSLDNVLGWLYADVDNVPPHTLPAGGRPYDGLHEGRYSQPYRGRRYPIVKGTCGNGLSVPSQDPHEDFPHVNVQLFGKDRPPPWDGRPPAPPAPKMEGFLEDFAGTLQSWDQFLQITQTYTPDDLPVLNGLARSFAVCDEWFSSVPSQTNPNRAFFHCGTSLGRESNQHETAVEQFETPTLWNALANRASWSIFYHEAWPPVVPLDVCYTRYTFPYLRKVEDGNPYRFRLKGQPVAGREASYRPFAEFADRAAAGDLPALSFIEPKWGFGPDERLAVEGNDYHPPTDTARGERLLFDVYRALRLSPLWDKSLLVVTFDEHGGTWDHVPPPWGAIPSGKEERPVEYPFAFDRFGVRVPTILVSPLIEEGTVFRAPDGKHYDHTSVLATLLRWQGVPPEEWDLGNRVLSAPTFENVLTRTEPRTDDVKPHLPPTPTTEPITIRNATNTKLYIYFGWKTGDPSGVVVPHHAGYLNRGDSYTYDTRKDSLSWDYFVQASYWVGDGVERSGEKIDHGYSGLSNEWRLFWPDWELLLHHQAVEFEQAKPTPAFTSQKDRKIVIRNDTDTRIYYHLYWKKAGRTVGEYKDYLRRGDSFAHDTAGDTFTWDYAVNVSFWVGDSTKRGGECVDGTFNKNWRFLWCEAKAIEHGQTLTVRQPKPGAAIYCPGA